MASIMIYILISILLGGVSCLFGKKLYFPILMLTVFCTVITISLSLFDLTLKVGIITVIVGMIAALLFRFFYRIGVVLLGGVLGGGIGLFIASALPPAASKYDWIVILLFTVVAGLCAAKWCDFFIMASTSFNGAFMIAVPICFLIMEFPDLQNFVYADGMMATVTNLNRYLNSQFSAENGVLIFLLTLTIAVGGFSFQISRNRKVKV